MAVIFDMDGVLFDSEPLHIRAWQAIMAPRGWDFEASWFLRWVGIPDWKLAGYLHDEFGMGASWEEVLQQKRMHYLAITSAELHPFPGVPEGLHALRARGIPIAVATSSNWENCRHTLNCTGLADYFPVQVTAEDVTKHKPEPDPFLRAAELLGTSPSQCTVIEDSPPASAPHAPPVAWCSVSPARMTPTPSPAPTMFFLLPRRRSVGCWGVRSEQ